jgi:hypothetical protein
MKKIMLLLVMAVLITGCTGIGIGKQKAETATVPHTGTKGITLSFLQNAPPSLMYIETGSTQVPYQIVIGVKNEGAYTTAPGIHLLGFDSNIFRNLDSSQNSVGSLEGRSAQNPEGGFTQFTKDVGIVNLPSGTDQLSLNLMVAACYPYQTEASLPVCIDPDPYGVVMAKACTPSGIPAASQGAPIAITSVQQESLPNKAIFKITVSNLGGGQVYFYPADCLNLRYSETDKLDYSSVTIGTNIQPTTCSPLSPLILTNGRATLTCIFNVPQNQAFTSTLNIKLNYGYMNTIQKAVKVKKI